MPRNPDGGLDRDYIVVVGNQGMGKTLWSRQFLRSRPRVIILDPIGEYEGTFFDNVTDLIEYVESNSTFQLRTNRDDELPRLVKTAMARPDTVFAIEEASRVIPPWINIRDEMPDLLDLIYRGRHTRTHFLVIAQRAATIHIHARSQWTRLITFRQTEPQDVRWIQNVAPIDDDLTTLPPLSYYDVTLMGVSRESLTLPRRKRKGVISP